MFSENTPMTLLRSAILLSALFILTHCSGYVSPNNGLLGRLNSRGPVLLSADNPYLAANLALAREMERSPVLKGFISHRGAPAALEVTRSTLSPYQVMLYYPEKSEQFSFEQAGEDWIVDGPNQIEREKLKELLMITRTATVGQPKLLSATELKTTSEEAHSEIVESTPKAVPTIVVVYPTAAPTVTPPPPPAPKLPSSEKSDRKEKASRFQSPSAVATSKAVTLEAKDLNEQIKSKSSHSAEMSPRGDLVHYITLPGENLSIIARWYTFDRSNAGRLARINNIKNSNDVSIGDTIIIPSYLVRNKNRLTQDGLDLLKGVMNGDQSAEEKPAE